MLSGQAMDGAGWHEGALCMAVGQSALVCPCPYCIQLFRERLSEKTVHATIPKGNMGYDQYIVPDTVAVELSFVAFL